MAQLVSALVDRCPPLSLADSRSYSGQAAVSDSHTPSFVPTMDYVGDSFTSDQTVFYSPMIYQTADSLAKPSRALLARRDF
jgi:hypothetical protein